MKLRLSWTDPTSQRPRRPLLQAPIALGQTFAAMPTEISGQSVSRMVIGDRQVLDFQALLVEIEGEIYLIDNGGQTYVNEQQVIGQARLNHGDRILLGETELQLQMMDAPPSAPGQRSTHLQAVPDPAIDLSHSLNGNGNGNGHYQGHPNGQPNGHNNGYPGTPQPGSPGQANVQAIPPIPDPVHNSGRQTNAPAIYPHGKGAEQSPPAEPSPTPAARPPEQPNQLPFPQNNGRQRPQASPANGQKPSTDGYVLYHGLAQPAQPQGQTPSPTNTSPANTSPNARADNPQAAAPNPPAPTPSPANMPKPMQLQSSQPSSGCRRSVGFLFKRPCGRNSSSGCDQCANGYSNHAYSADYDLYEGYGRFEPGDWGYGLLEKQRQH